MYKLILKTAFLLIPFLGMSQSSSLSDPTVWSPNISPAPLLNVASNGVGTINFTFGNTGPEPIAYVVGKETKLDVSLSRVVPRYTDLASNISGTYVSFFNWSYNASTNTIRGTQNKAIPEGDGGTIQILVKVASNSTEAEITNGFIVNVVPSVLSQGFNSLTNDAVSSYTWTVPSLTTNPDFNVTTLNVPVSGNVSTNDIVPTGTTYSNPSPNPSNPSTTLPVMNPNGTYTFTPTVPGEYTFVVPVCRTGQTIDCETQLLTISVVDPNSSNPPLANTDISSSPKNGNVSINVLSNDKVVNTNGVLSPPIVTSNPTNGTTSINPDGTIKYTPNTNYVGRDYFTYTLCDVTTSPLKCDTALVYVVVEDNTVNTVVASDDYNNTIATTPISGNVKTNDVDPQGNTMNVTAQTINDSKGTLVLNNDGTYTFTAKSGFVGAADYVYTVCDNVTPPACANATLHITVKAGATTVPVVGNPDNGTTLASGGTPITNVTSNDLINNSPVVLGTNATITPTGTWPTGIVLDPNTGKVTVAPGTTPGVYNLTYQLCEKSTTNCVSVPVTLTISPDIKTTPDNGLTSVIGGTPVSNITSNDLVNGVTPVLGTNATVTPTGTWPAGITLNTTTGQVVVAQGTTPGIYNVSYILCDKATTPNCKTEVVSITVTPLAPDTVVRQLSYVKYSTTNLSTTICTNTSDLNSVVGTKTYTSCGIPANSGYTVKGPDANGCFTYELDTTNIPTQDVKTCQIVCVGSVCDTTYVVLKTPVSDVSKPIIPNYFSPNGDGVNDKFDLTEYLKETPNVKLMIYNRWGNIVWRSAGYYNNDWSGEANDGNPLPDGVYYFMLETEDNFRNQQTGFVEIMRK